LIEDYIQIILW